MCQFYEDQRDLFHQIASLKIGDLAQWNLPAAGMFFWLKITGFEDTEKLVSHSANTHNVLLVPGKVNCTRKNVQIFVKFVCLGIFTDHDELFSRSSLVLQCNGASNDPRARSI